MNTYTGEVVSGAELERMIKKYGKEHLVPLPRLPDPNCKTCSGRGSIRSFGTYERYRTCPQCYPELINAINSSRPGLGVGSDGVTAD